MASVLNQPNRKRSRPDASDASRRDADSTRAQKRSRPSNAAAATGTSSNTRPGPSNSRSSAAALLRGPNPQVARNRIGQTSALHDVTPSQIQNKPPPKRRSVQTKAPRRAPVQAGGRSGATQRRQQESSPEEQPLRSRRQNDEEEDEEEDSDAPDDDEPASPEKPYAHVAPFVRRIRQSTIRTKWSPLGRGSIKALTSILQLAQRPTLQRLAQSASRRKPTEDALQLITKRILDKISGVAGRNVAGLPFPPASLPTRTKRGRPRGGRAEQDGGRETELNFESVLDAKQTLERQLDPVLHAVDLLGEEARRLEEELEGDYETLRLLEADARTRARDNRSLLKRAHELAPESAGRDGRGPLEEANVRFEKTEGAALNPFQDTKDKEVRALVTELGGHVDRIRGNTAQTEGLGDEIARTRAALQNVLAKKLSAARYEQVVLGR